MTITRKAARTPNAVADALVELIRLAQEEGIVGVGDVWTDREAVRPAELRRRVRDEAPVNIYVDLDPSGPDGEPLIITVGWLR